MNLSEIKKIIKLVEKSNILELEVEEDGSRVRVSKASPTPNPFPVEAPNPVTQMAPAQEVPTSSVPPPEEGPPAAEIKNIQEVKSPMVGTFYRAPAPNADPYVEVGDAVVLGQTLCIIEAMKIMNEIESELSGRISRIVVEDGQPVEYNQPLFLIEASI
ncbi:acetyl-CoA carboxylase biotin carboxyl carrier protein [candidate division KSB1 bacterium]|nr:acetyl-CoA carboxylase biotin carboxyl carrier protein [candidate division KSB1 bacterium]